ncbi:MAG TPA: hypothetical protein VMR54_13090 [Thermoanaerobaculia bacterium]|nr:hypothetical protein [Thermoanaerobaculia bacterium]
MSKATAGGLAFAAAGVAFTAFGISWQRAYLPIGAAFVLIDLVFIGRGRRSGPLE